MEKLVDKLDTELFISEIEKHPCIWDSSIDEYSDKIAKRNAWTSLITTFIGGFEDKSTAEKKELGSLFQRKWKSLRNSFTREVAKQKSEKKSGVGTGTRKSYVYFEHLKFLEPAIKPPKSYIEDDKTEDEDDNNADSLEKETAPSAKRARKVKCEKPEEDSPECLKRELQHFGELDEDSCFMLSLVSELKRVPDLMKLDVKTRLLSVFSQARVEYQRMSGYGGLNQQSNQSLGQFSGSAFHQQGFQGVPFNVTVPVTIAPVYHNMVPSAQTSQQTPEGLNATSPPSESDAQSDIDCSRS